MLSALARIPYATTLWILGAVFALVAVSLGIAPRYRADWALENALVAVFLVAAPFIHRRMRLSRLSWLLIVLFLCLHEVGAHYTYAEVPYDDWCEGAFGFRLSERLGFARNHFDRLVHFLYGLLLAYPVREVFLRVAEARGFWGYFLPLVLTMSTSMLFELIEWGAAMVFGGDLGIAYLGTQGDEWDSHRDMALASLGALVAMLLTAAVNARFDRDFAREWRESLRVKHAAPLGEEELERIQRARDRGFPGNAGSATLAGARGGIAMAKGAGTADRVTVAAVNFAPVYGNAKATLEKMAADVEEAAAQGADLVVFPEGALVGCHSCAECREQGGPCEACLAAAETVPGPASDAMARLARDHDLYVVFGLPERDAQEPARLYNAAAVVGPEGALGTYRKVHLGEPPWVTEGITFTPGTSLPLFPTRFGPIGIQICYDFWFNPELTRILALKGAQLVVVPVGSFDAPGRPDGMRATALARAQENLIHVVVSNSVGGPGEAGKGYSGRALTEAPRPNYYAGHSLIAGPAFPRFGVVLAEAGAAEEMIVTTINLRQQARFEKIFDYRRWRRGRLASASRLVADEFTALAEAAEGDARTGSAGAPPRRPEP